MTGGDGVGLGIEYPAHGLVPSVVGVPAGSLVTSSVPNQLGGRPWTMIASEQRIDTITEPFAQMRTYGGYTRARDMHGDPPRRGASTEKGLRNDRVGVDIALS